MSLFYSGEATFWPNAYTCNSPAGGHRKVSHGPYCLPVTASLAFPVAFKTGHTIGLLLEWLLLQEARSDSNMNSRSGCLPGTLLDQILL